MGTPKGKPMQSNLPSGIDDGYESQAGLTQEAGTRQETQSDVQNIDPSHPNLSQADRIQSSPSNFDMRSISQALPDQGYRTYPQVQPQTQYNVSPSYNPNYMFNYQNNQFSGQMSTNYNMPFPQQMPPNSSQIRAYQGAQLPSHGMTGQLPHPSSPMFYQQQPISQQLGPMQGSVYNQSSQQIPNNYSTNPSQFSRMGSGYYVPQLRVEGFSTITGSNHGQYGPFEGSVSHQSVSPSSGQSPSALRGPPRKPKQSGHALWVGNLPPGTHIIDLKDHFSRDATDDIESVFLISKSNCAFVNYRTEETCSAAMTRFHDSRFQGVRLVCRLRRGSSSATSPSPNTLPAVSDRGVASATIVSDESRPVFDLSKEIVLSEPELRIEEAENTEKTVKEKYFIVKSLTVEDLERSVASGIWATQSHNEETLNQAFKAAENVYLIFSANKSGEYFGYARMNQLISEDNEAENDSQEVEPAEIQPVDQKPLHNAPSADVPLTIPTPATATAPKGHIIDDSARGTIFWEAEIEEATLQPGVAGVGNTEQEDTSGDEAGGRGLADTSTTVQQSSFGKPFKITWLSTDSLPFYRTRGLRNPWNANREVKIARDGTELEPSVGRRLIGMFSQQQLNTAATRGLNQQQHFMMNSHHQHPQNPYGSLPSGYGYGLQGHGNPYNRPY